MEGVGLRAAVPEERAPGRGARVLGKAVAVFVLAWAVVSLGLAVVRIEAENYTVRARTPASATQAQRGDEFAASLPAIDALLPRSASVLVVWVSSTPGYQFGAADVPDGAVWWAYSVGNYWLYPRRVFVSTDRAAAANTSLDAVIVVRLPSDSEPAVAPGLVQAASYTSSIQAVTVYRGGGSP
jgi:hypothetical protein